MALRPRLAASLPFAPKHWQIHHRPYIDHRPETLIPEIGVTYSEKFARWTGVHPIQPKTDEAGVSGQAQDRKPVLSRSFAQAGVVGQKRTNLLSNRQCGGDMQGVQGP